MFSGVSRAVLNRNGNSSQPYLFPVFTRNTFNVSEFSKMFSLGFVCLVFFLLDIRFSKFSKFVYITNLFNSFIFNHEYMLNFISIFYIFFETILIFSL